MQEFGHVLAKYQVRFGSLKDTIHMCFEGKQSTHCVAGPDVVHNNICGFFDLECLSKNMQVNMISHPSAKSNLCIGSVCYVYWLDITSVKPFRDERECVCVDMWQVIF